MSSTPLPPGQGQLDLTVRNLGFHEQNAPAPALVQPQFDERRHYAELEKTYVSQVHDYRMACLKGEIDTEAKVWDWRLKNAVPQPAPQPIDWVKVLKIVGLSFGALVVLFKLAEVLKGGKGRR